MMNITEKIPDWIHWIAQDENGEWWGFEEKPTKHKDDNGGYWTTRLGLATRINNIEKIWAKSLRKI